MFEAKNTEAERRACEIRLRAERKAGQLLSKMERAKRGRPAKTSDATTLNDLNITRDQSSRWQALANVPEEDFEAALGGEEKPSTNGIIAKPPKMPATSLWLRGSLRARQERDLAPGGARGSLKA